MDNDDYNQFKASVPIKPPQKVSDEVLRQARRQMRSPGFRLKILAFKLKNLF